MRRSNSLASFSTTISGSFDDVVFSGSKATSALLAGQTDKNINLHSVGMLCDSQTFNSKLSFDVSDSTIVSTSMDAALDDLVKTRLTLTNYY